MNNPCRAHYKYRQRNLPGMNCCWYYLYDIINHVVHNYYFTGNSNSKLLSSTWNHYACFPGSSMFSPFYTHQFSGFFEESGSSGTQCVTRWKLYVQSHFNQLFGTDGHHVQLRQTLLALIQNNYKTYEPYWIEHTSCGVVKFDEHVSSLAKAGSWGTLC